MKCKGVYAYICENLDADVKSARCRMIKKHLDSCPDCSAYLDSLKKTILLYRREAGPSVPLTMHKRLVKAIDVAMPGVRKAKRQPGTISRKTRQ